MTPLWLRRWLPVVLLMAAATGLALAAPPPQPAVEGWTSQGVTCVDGVFQMAYARQELRAALRLRPANAPGFVKTPSFSVTYVVEDPLDGEAETAIKTLTEQAAAALTSQDQGQWTDVLPCEGTPLAATDQADIPHAGQPVRFRPQGEAVPLADLIALATVAAIIVMILAHLRRGWHWFRVQPFGFKVGCYVLVAVTVVLRLGPSLILDELFHGPWRLHDSQALPLGWGYYPAGFKALLFTKLWALPTSMETLWWVNRALGVGTPVLLALGAYRLAGPWAGLGAGTLLALHPHAALYARGDAEAAAVQFALCLWLLTLTAKRPGAWVWMAAAGLWCFQQRPETILFLPLFALGTHPKRWLAAGAALALHLPYLVGGFAQKAGQTAGGGLFSPAGLDELLGLGPVSLHPAAATWPHALLWLTGLITAVWLLRQRKWRPALLWMSALVVLCTFLTHRTGNPALGQLRYMMVPLPALCAAAGWGLARWEARGFALVLALCVTALGAQRVTPRPPPTVQDQEWIFLQKHTVTVGKSCVLALPGHQEERGPLKDVSTYAARPLLPLSWNDHCTLLRTPPTTPRDETMFWVYLGPYCHRFTPEEEPACEKFRASHQGRKMTRKITVSPKLVWQQGEWDEDTFTIGFYQLDPAAFGTYAP